VSFSPIILIRGYKVSHFSAQIVSFCYTTAFFRQNLLKIRAKQQIDALLSIKMSTFANELRLCEYLAL
jgi:hypothetical protein